ncbi:hypothetical protein MBT84_00640 [Streptomyces sp. MBT84]|uniref:hypothetical protein n=1 Tax=unclassified Streptomyces TaxID=2593676 RepID=UPI001C6F35E5|nr:hypothetical protein [Streptomyces sp. MBT84]MBW8698067.1 hypothetical protein [Streptomyces sp. MBT84]
MRVWVGVMDVETEALMVHRPRAEVVPDGDRGKLLVDAALGEPYVDDLFEHGRSGPMRPVGHRYGRCALLNTLGPCRPYSWTGHRWDHMRDTVEPGLREAPRRFNDGLF